MFRLQLKKISDAATGSKKHNQNPNEISLSFILEIYKLIKWRPEDTAT